MLAIVLSAILIGLDGRVVRVEVDVAPGLPGFSIVGLADAALQEARERVRGAIRNSGFEYPPRRLTVNLAPADVRKAGASLDVAIAVGILLGSGQIRASRRWALLGELALSGQTRWVPGLLPMALALRRQGSTRIVVPIDGLAEAGLVRDAAVVACPDLATAAAMIHAGRRRSQPVAVPVVGWGPPESDGTRRPDGRDGTTRADEPDGSADPTRGGIPDLAEVRGQLAARRALEIALAGGHGLLLVGPPGSGKTLLARTVPDLLPPLDDDEALAATTIESAAGRRPAGLVRRRPFRAPHHTSSYAAMVGGGPRLSPGEVSLANGGVLFLDELPEFGRDVLEALREPLEDGRVLIARVGRATTFPAAFQLIAAMNPCPCGRAGDRGGDCRCPVATVERYAGRISGPLRDRIDLRVEMPRVPAGELFGGREPEPSSIVAARIAEARRRQLGRQGVLNGRLSGRRLRTMCNLDPAGRHRAAELAELEGYSARGTERLLRVARTIADIDGDPWVTIGRLEEAAAYRPRLERARAMAV